jgi:hypothetical protein
MRLTFSDYEALKLGTKTLECSSCQGQVVIDFNPGNVQFVLKDGESGGWMSKAGRENKYRVNRRQVMERRQRDHAPNPKLVPNFAGDTTASWGEARSMAFEKAYDETRSMSAAQAAASTYDPLVNRESSR